LKSLASFEKTPENKDFMEKEVYAAVESANKMIIKQLKKTIKIIEEVK
jgi:hypothetical protein